MIIIAFLLFLIISKICGFFKIKKMNDERKKERKSLILRVGGVDEISEQDDTPFALENSGRKKKTKLKKRGVNLHSLFQP